MNQKLKILPINLLDEYSRQIGTDIEVAFENLRDAEISTDTFNFYTSVSAIASSRIEGEQMEVDSYLKHKMLNVEYEPSLVQKPDDLYRAYIFAQQNKLNSGNFLEAHKLITGHLLPPNKRGQLRTGNMVVMEHKTGRIQFEAAPGQQVKELFDMLWQDIEQLKIEQLTHTEVFYFASSIHLIFVNIHPFDDGNGRAELLLEKWFIAEKLSSKAWFLQSELYYYNHVADYYKNLNRLGIFYDQLDYAQAMPFLLMLTNSLTEGRE
jgi:Fic family protein